MSKVYADAIEASAPNLDLVLGATGDSVTVTADSVSANSIKDVGGNVLFTSSGGMVAPVGDMASNLHFISTTVIASTTDNVIFTGIDSTYDTYIFKYSGVRGDGDNNKFRFRGSNDGGTSFGLTKTTSFWAAYFEQGSGSGDSRTLGYLSAEDEQQSTAWQPLGWGLGNDATASISGEMWLFNPSSTTFVKHFYGINSHTYYQPYVMNNYFGGYFNITGAGNYVDAIQFGFSSNNIGNGTISLYGLST